MPTEKYFSQCPEFPSDSPIADIPKISYHGIETGAKADVDSLWDACRNYGFFLLDLRGSLQGEALIKKAEENFDLTGTTLHLPQAELDRFAYNPPKDLVGYKTSGLLKTDDGKLDATEMYTVSQDDMLGNEPRRSNPAPVEEHRQECASFLEGAHITADVILARLSNRLGLDESILLNLTAIDKPSTTHLRLLLTRPQEGAAAATSRVTLGAHTDMGIITVLFHVAGGLQILPAGAENKMENWRFVRPEQGFALVNLGDTLVEWTGGILRSALHRVVTPPGKQSTVERRSLAYLVRSSKGAPIRRLHSETGVIPGLANGEKGDTRIVDEWASERAAQIIKGELRPQTYGGAPVVAAN